MAQRVGEVGGVDVAGGAAAVVGSVWPAVDEVPPFLDFGDV